MVRQLIYTSRARAPFTADELRALLVKARHTNTILGITGMLFHIDGAFFQVLEGDPDRVDALYARIRADHRHSQALILMVRELSSRNFPDWSMGFFDGSGRAHDLPGYRSDRGFADLVGDTTKLVQICEDFRGGRWRSIAA
jgi:hypothetical protein